ncbi:MAG: hypothetical protein PUB43_05450 [Oscillospiraceae bacterium]|nr:hypothetical protein [Oscillospiraceae bacterium]
MLNNAFFTVVLYSNNHTAYNPQTLFLSIDEKNYKNYKLTGINTELMLYDSRILDTLHFSGGSTIPDIEWEYEYVLQRIENYYKALIKSIENAIKNGVITRVNVFYPFIRSSYINDPSKHGSTIYTFFTEFIYSDRKSSFCISEEIPDDFYALRNTSSAVEYAKRALFNVRNSSFFISKYQYYFSEEDYNFSANHKNTVVVNYTLSHFIKINFNIDISKIPARIIMTSNKIDVIESCDYNDRFKMNLCKNNSVILLNSSADRSYDKFAYKSYKRTFECILLYSSIRIYLKQNNVKNCLSVEGIRVLTSVKKYLLSQSIKLGITLPTEVTNLAKKEKGNIILENAKDICAKTVVEFATSKLTPQ